MASVDRVILFKSHIKGFVKRVKAKIPETELFASNYYNELSDFAKWNCSLLLSLTHIGVRIEVKNKDELPRGWTLATELHISVSSHSSDSENDVKTTLNTKKVFRSPHALIFENLQLYSFSLLPGSLPPDELMIEVEMRKIEERIDNIPSLEAWDLPKTNSEGVVIICPWPECGLPFIIEEGNCLIFRHAVDKRSNTPIAPHTPEVECLRMKQEGKIFGCGKPIRVTFNRATASYVGEQCEYL